MKLDPAVFNDLTKFNSPLASNLTGEFVALDDNAKIVVLLVLLVVSYIFGGKIVIRNWKIIPYLPSFVYEIAQNGAFVQNWLTTGLINMQPSKSGWNEPDHPELSAEALKLAGGTDISVLKAQVLAGKDIVYEETDLMRLYDSLQPAVASEIFVGRTWEGKVVRTNRTLLDLAEWCVIRPISYLGFGWGKRFRDQHTGDAMLLHWMKRIYIPLPFGGNASVNDAKWRGVVTGSISYDSLNWTDYFKVLENDPASKKVSLLGVYTTKSAYGGFLKITWDPDTPVDK